MVRILGAALLFGYVVGVAASLLMLPAPVVEPLYGGIAVGSVLVLAAIVAAIRYAPGSRRPAFMAGAAPARFSDEQAGAAAHEDGEVEPPATSTEAESQSEAEEPSARRPSASDDAIDLRPDPIDRLISPRALWHLLERDRLDVVLTRVACLPEDGREVFQASPRLGTDDELHLEPGHYLAVAARAGLVPRIDRLAIMRCAALLDGPFEGRDVRILCPVSASSLDDPEFVAALERLLEARPEIAGRLVLLVGQLRLHRPAGADVARLGGRGLLLALRRLSLRGLDASELEARGVALVRLEAPQFALGAAPDRLRREVEALQQALEQRGIGLVLDRADAPSVAADARLGPHAAARASGVEEGRSSAA